MGRVTYDVPLVTQGNNPICWVPCMAMVSSERLGYSLGVGHFTNGYDPSNSSIPNPAHGMGDFYNRLDQCGFTSIRINAVAGDVEDVLREYGPFILTH